MFGVSVFSIDVISFKVNIFVIFKVDFCYTGNVYFMFRYEFHKWWFFDVMLLAFQLTILMSFKLITDI